MHLATYLSENLQYVLITVGALLFVTVALVACYFIVPHVFKKPKKDESAKAESDDDKPL